jgi:hypothetical protein
LLARFAGSDVAADGYSWPYIMAICFASLLYGLLGLLLCYRIARRFTSAWAATAASLLCWLASPLIFYMYISPPWSHTGGLFSVALFIWYWLQSGTERSMRQWLLLGLLGGLMVMNREQLGLFLLLPAMESLWRYWQLARTQRWLEASRLFGKHCVFLLIFVLSLSPQLLAYIVLNGRLGPSEVVLEKLGYVPDDPYAHGLLGSGRYGGSTAFCCCCLAARSLRRSGSTVASAQLGISAARLAFGG